MRLNFIAMEASDETINVCVELINSDSKLIATLPAHLSRALELCDTIIRKTLVDLEAAFVPFKEYPFEFKNIPEGVYVPSLRIPGTSGNLSGFGFGKMPQAGFVGSTS